MFQLHNLWALKFEGSGELVSAVVAGNFSRSFVTGK
jgi:hypothetical protein